MFCDGGRRDVSSLWSVSWLGPRLRNGPCWDCSRSWPERTHLRCLLSSCSYGYGLIVDRCWRGRSPMKVWWIWRMVALNGNDGGFVNGMVGVVLMAAHVRIDGGMIVEFAIGPRGLVDVVGWRCRECSNRGFSGSIFKLMSKPVLHQVIGALI